MATALKHEVAGDIPDAKLHRDWAYGVFLGWSASTQGWQPDSDDQIRLEQLTEGRKKPRP